MARDFLESAKKSAINNGGKCLTESHRNGTRAFFRFICSRGHIWEMNAANVIAGNWCPRCKRVERHFEEIKEIVKSKKGKILENLRNSRTPLLVECKAGHRWRAYSSSITRGSWCRKCAFLRSSNSINDMRELAGKKGGQCLSTEYLNNKTKLKWRCRMGHEWEAKPNGIICGGWCPKCAGTQRKTLEDMRKIARSKGGQCLSRRYYNNNTKLLWLCSKGHKWKAVPSNVSQKAWCPICACDWSRFTLKDLQKIAKKRDGKCLETNYRNSRTPVLWECIVGHRWRANAKAVSMGTWCPECARLARMGPRQDLSKYQKYAEAHRGRLISKQIEAIDQELVWECSGGHQWLAKWKNLTRRGGRWCPICEDRRLDLKRIVKVTIEKLAVSSDLNLKTIQS